MVVILRLDTAGKAELEKTLLHNPQQYGYDTATWIGAPVRDYIKKRYGVEYKKAHIYNILHSIGFGFQKWKGYFPEAKEREEKLEAVKKLQTLDKNSVTVFEDEASLSNTAVFTLFESCGACMSADEKGYNSQSMGKIHAAEDS